MAVSSHHPSVDSTGPSHFMPVQYFTLFPPRMRNTSRLWHKRRHNRQGSSETTACTVMTALAKAGVYDMVASICALTVSVVFAPHPLLIVAAKLHTEFAEVLFDTGAWV